MDTFDVRNAFHRMEMDLRGKLEDADLTTHPGTKGDAGELAWARLLNEFLPERYRATDAFAVDVNGNRSEQLDLVIYDRHWSPLLFEIGAHPHIPAESIYAVFEVKPELNRDYVHAAARKVASVRRLTRTSGEYRHAGGTATNEPFRIIGGSLTRRAGWSPPFGDPFVEALSEADEDGKIDIGCVAESGAFSIRDGVVEYFEQDIVMSFLTDLMVRIQALGPPPALDYTRWGQSGLSGASGRLDLR